MKILIAEDDETSLRVLKRSVEKLGHVCASARNGQQAWELFRDDGADVIISDWVMPEMDGMELCRRVRNSGRDYTYFIFLTALDDRQSFLQGMQNGADDYLHKPIDLVNLEVRLLAAARIMALQQELIQQKAALEHLNDELFEQARRDPLTQLANRLRLREDLDQVSARRERYGHIYTVAMCDIDFFKPYNDYYGHLAGDEVLRLVARALQSQCRTGDAVYRFGGEEFLLILPEQGVRSASVALERMLQAVEKLAIPHEARTPPAVITVSAGLADVRPGDKKSVYSLLKEADVALYQAKGSGRNRLVAFRPGIEA